MQGLTRTASADKKCGGGKAPDYLCAKAATSVARCDRREQPRGSRGRGTRDRGAKGGDPLRLPAPVGRRPLGRKTQAQVHMCKR